jgi:hypothetical protein
LRWIVSFALFLAVGAAWAFASPIYSGPDEPSHVIHAAAIPRGDLIGTEHKGKPNVDVTAPRIYGRGPECFAFKPEVPADCFFLADTLHGDGTLKSYTARYLPPYSAFIGFGSYWIPPGAGQIYLMRMLGAVIVAALLASAVSTVLAVGTLGFALGFLFALTPMALYFSGIVNPSTPEIAAGIAVWTHGIALTGVAVGDDPRVLRRFGIAACVLCATRPLSPVWLLLTVIILVFVAGRPRVMDLIRRRSVQVWAGAAVAITLIQVVWSAWAKPLSEGNTAQKGLDRPISFIFEQSIGKLYWSNTREMIGMFGWLDTVTPMATTIFWLVAVGALVLLAISVGSRRAAWTVGVTLLLAYLVPVAIETARASSNNLVWHGRYTLPFAVGIPLLAGYTLRSLEGTTLAIKRFAWWLVVAFVVAQVLAFNQALRRYTSGVNGPVWFWTSDTFWSPPVPSWILVFGYVALMVGIVAVVIKIPMAPRTAPVRVGAQDSPPS